MSEVPLYPALQRSRSYGAPPPQCETGISLPNNQRQHRALHIQQDVLPYSTLCALPLRPNLQ